MNGVELIAQERKRQIEVEGWDAEHDKEHSCGDLAMAGACYALDIAKDYGLHDRRQMDAGCLINLTNLITFLWPWDGWWKPTRKEPIKQLVKAGALIAAEIDKLQAELPVKE